MEILPADPQPARSGAAPIPGDLVDGLNPPQREAVEYRGDALLIVAGAGSGKTRVLTHRIAGLIATHEAWPSQILAITFTNKAAAEMRERVGALLGETVEGMWISTFHSACVRILRREAERFGYPASFTIYDSADSKALIKRIVKSLEAESLGVTVPQAMHRISGCKNELIDPDGFARTVDLTNPREQLILEIYRQYQRELQRNRAFDFDDLIAQTVWLFRAHPQIAALYQRRFRHILVDEYQDTNHAQYALIRELTRPVAPENVPLDTRLALDADGSIPAASLTVVGDSDQSIYAFRGADIRNITEFERDFPGAKTLLLEQNYRSTQTILDAANSVIANNFDRRVKNLWTAAGAGAKIQGYAGRSAHDEAQFVADEIHRLHDQGVSYNEMAVFYRTNAQTRALEEILVRAAVPYRLIGGTKFYERAEVKDVVAYLMAVANPNDDLSVRRIVNSPKRSIGPASETAIANYAAANELSFREALGHADALGFGPKLRSAVAELAEALNEAEESITPERPTGAVPVAQMLERLLDRVGYITALRATGNPQDDARADNVVEFINVAKEFDKHNPSGTLIEFLTEVALVAAADEIDDESGVVSLMTLHTAKGLEYDTVFITGVEEMLLPHKMSVDEPGGLAEERRLFYVGITRARRMLHMTMAVSRTQFGETAPSLPSRFLDEVPSELIDWKQSPAEVVAAPVFGGTGYQRGGYGTGYGRAGRGGSGGAESGPLRSGRGLKSEFKPTRGNRSFDNQVTGRVTDNSDLVLESGDRVRHSDFGEGTVRAVLGTGTKKIAEVDFDTAGRKKLLIKIAPLEKLSEA